MERAMRVARWAAVAMAMLIVAYLVVAWLSRRGPAFERGGAFGSPASRADALPAAGVYEYTARGMEHVDLGGFSACDWPVRSVVLTVSHGAQDTVIDQRIGERLERTIYAATTAGDELTYAASSVTCLGIRTTSEDNYEPPALRFRARLDVDDTWTTTASTQQRTERATVSVVRRERISVPAGEFDVVVVQLDATFEGRITGETKNTYWFDPGRRIWVKHEATTTARRSGSTFTSAYTAELASTGP